MRMRTRLIFAVLLAALAAVAWLRTPSGESQSAQGGSQEGGFRSEVDLVSVYFTMRCWQTT